MSDMLETQLRAEMRPDVDGTPPPDWATIVQGAARLQRRDRMVQRFAVAAFVVAMGAALALAGSGWSDKAATTPADGPDEQLVQGTVSTGHLVAGLAILALLGLAFLIAAGRREPSSGWSLGQRYLIVPPVVYPVVALLGPSVQDPSWVTWVAVAFKLQTVVCLPLLLLYVARRIRQQPDRVTQCVAVWSSLGLAAVLLARAFIDDIVRAGNEFGTFRLWPEDFGHNQDQWDVIPGLDQQPGAEWNASTILQLELISVVVIACLSGAVLWALRKTPVAAVGALMVSVWFALMTFCSIVTPMGFLIDYDFFIGDITLSTTFVELTFFPAPGEATGMLNVSAAALSLWALFWLWGGPVAPETPKPDDDRTDSSLRRS